MDPSRRFTSRVDDYRKYRPGYPPRIVADLVAGGRLAGESVVADVGSGTGLLARLFLENGNRVLGIEPNAAMRAAGEEDLRAFDRFTSIEGSAEQTTLADAGVDLIAAGQAFHWFDRARAKLEFRRILRPGRWCVLIWNDRLTNATPFLIAYEQLLREFSTDYAAVDHKQITDALLEEFFAPGTMVKQVYSNRQVFDYQSLRGRLLSSSYAPPEGHEAHEPMLSRLASIFQEYQCEGHVSFEYETKVYAGKL